MTEHLIIGVQPEHKIQEINPFAIAPRLASVTESFQNKAPNTGVENRAGGPDLLFPNAYQSANPVSSNYNPIETKIYLPEINGSGTRINGPIDGPTHLNDRADIQKNSYDAAIIAEVNRMLETENYSGAEVILGRELTIDEIRNRQLGAPDRYTLAKAGQPSQFPATSKIQTAANPANPPSLSDKAKANPIGIPPSTRQEEAQLLANPIGTNLPQTYEEAYEYNRNRGRTIEGDRSEIEKQYVKDLQEKVDKLEQTLKANKNVLSDENKRYVQHVIDRDNQYAQQRRQGLVGHGIQFGRFTVHPEKLANGELSMKYTHNGKKISDLPNRKLHPALQQAVHDTVHGQPTTGTGLSDADIQYLHKIVHRSQAGGDVKAGIPLPPGQIRRARMMVILGEMQAGNDNPALKTELAQLLKLLVGTKGATRSEAQLIRRTFLS
jgi:hypothetical protein